VPEPAGAGLVLAVGQAGGEGDAVLLDVGAGGGVGDGQPQYRHGSDVAADGHFKSGFLVGPARVRAVAVEPGCEQSRWLPVAVNPDALINCCEIVQKLVGPIDFILEITNRGNETFSRLMAISDIQQALNDEHLTVAGLKPGQYILAIDDRPIGTFSDTDLSAGINLADYHTPMRDQAQSAQWAIRDRVQAHFVRMRMQINKVDLGSPDTIEALNRKLEDDIYRSVQPVSHRFTLTPVS